MRQQFTGGLCAVFMTVAVLLVLAPTVAAKTPKRPVALVESIENAPKAKVTAFDYLYEKQKIKLGKTGVLVVAYFNSCVVETITGGSVKVGKMASKVSKGKVTSEEVACIGPSLLVAADGSEAGAVVKRVSPFDAKSWHEVVVRTFAPIFKWQPDKKRPEAQVTLTYLDVDPPRVIWEGTVSSGYLAYPSGVEAPVATKPYGIEVRFAKGDPLTAVFTVDPELEVSDDLVNRIVPIVR